MSKFTVTASVFRANLTANQNLERHETALSYLRENGFTDFETVVGVYHEDGMPEPSREVSLRIKGLEWKDISALTPFYLDTMSQDCILITCEDNGLSTLKGADWFEHLGTWTNVSKAEALELGIYTLDSKGFYWAAI